MQEQSTWSWEARDSSGVLHRGTIAAATAADVAARLRNEGRVVLGIEPAIENPIEERSSHRSAFLARSADRTTVAGFIRRLAVMLEAGVPLAEALLIEENQATDSFRKSIADVREKVESGTALSDAMSEHARLFPSVAIGLVRAAEAVGDLPGMLTQLADWMQRDQKLRRQVRNALAYPTMLAVVGTVITVLLITLVMPRFEAIYAQRQTTLPPITEFVLGCGRFLVDGWSAWGPALLLLSGGMLFALRTAKGRAVVERFRFDAPIVRAIVRPADLVRAMRTLGVLVGAGVPLLDAIQICRGLSGWRRWGDFWDSIESSVRDGRGLADRFEKPGLVPASAQAMVAAGERSGQLPRVLDRVADAADEDLETAIKRVGVLLEPLAILVLGSVIAVVAIALLLPVLKMGTVVG